MAQPSPDLVTALESELLVVASFRTADYFSINSDRKRKFRALLMLEQKTLDCRNVHPYT